MGLLPLLLFMLLTNYFSYVISFVTAAVFCVVSILLFYLLKGRFYQFMLFPSATALIFYSLLMFLEIKPVLFVYSPLMIELLLVIALTITLLIRRPILRKIRSTMGQTINRSHLRMSISEFFLMVQILQNLYTLHLFSVLVFTILPDSMKNIHFEYILMHDFGILIGIGLMIYEQIRLQMLRGNLKKEIWLPVLNERGQVIGRIAQSISMKLTTRRFRHPAIRVMVMYDGKLYLTKRGADEPVSPGMLDCPIRSFVLFNKTVEHTVAEKTYAYTKDRKLSPRFLIRYSLDNEKTKELISLFVLNLQTEEQLHQVQKQAEGKLWTIKQIEEEVNTGLFSSYFLHELPYLQTTIFIAEQYACRSAAVSAM